jgi:hypothetical protein
MRKIIHHLRRQPEQTRRHILHVATLVCGAILVSLWIYSLGSSFGSLETQAKLDNTISPLSSLKGNLIGGYNSIPTLTQNYNYRIKINIYGQKEFRKVTR